MENIYGITTRRVPARRIASALRPLRMQTRPLLNVLQSVPMARDQTLQTIVRSAVQRITPEPITTQLPNGVFQGVLQEKFQMIQHGALVALGRLLTRIRQPSSAWPSAQLARRLMQQTIV